MNYLHWAKIHPRYRYELTSSGVPDADLLTYIDTPLPQQAILRVGGYGHPELLQRVADRYGVSPAQVAYVPGASAGIFASLITLLRPGDTVLIEEPYYDPALFAACTAGLHLQHVPRRSEHGYAICPNDLTRALVSSRAKAVFITNHHNPSGHYTDQQEMANIASICAAHQAWMIVDEVYLDSHHLILNSNRWTAATLGNNVVTINSLTKLHGLSGLRCGWLLLPEECQPRLQEAVDAVGFHSCGPADWLALQAMDHLDQLEQRFRSFCDAGRQVLAEYYPTAVEDITRKTINGKTSPAAVHHPRQLTCYPNHGTIFAWFKLPQGVNADDLHHRLVTEYDTQITSGSFFGKKDNIRIALSLPPDDLREALHRIEEATRRLQSA